MGIRFTKALWNVLLTTIVGCFWTGTSLAQLFPGLAGEELADAIRAEFTPVVLLNDTQAKDTLYAKVFIQQDSVRCIYSGLARFLPAGVDPSQWLFGTGQEVHSLNLEHSWPQAKGAGDGTRGNTDMHHLYPSRTEINSYRANFPFAEIVDHLTQRWFYREHEMTSKPLSGTDLYSEYRNGSFEPRESVKGDIARAMIYFWTIYREDALQADPNFFELQRTTFCDWHLEDPVDQEEIDRNGRIALYQGGSHNPFILDCGLVKRTYCPDMEDCSPLGIEALVSRDDSQLVYSYDTRRFSIRGGMDRSWMVFIFDALGRQIDRFELMTGPGEIVSLPKGWYIAMAQNRQHFIRCTFLVP